MEKASYDLAIEVNRLQRCMNDLISVLALPAVWKGSQPDRILEIVLDALLGMLGLDFVYARISVGSNETPIEALKVGHSYEASTGRDDIREALERWSIGELRSSQALISWGGQEVSILLMQMGMNGDLGFIIAGSRRPSFPEQTERLVLGIAANQTDICLQQTFKLSDQVHLASELDHRISERTAELAAANQVLRNEIAERREVEKRLLESEGRLKHSELMLSQVIDAIPTLAWSMLPDGPNEFLSKRWHEYTGLSREESNGWGWQVTFHPEDLPSLMDVWGQLLTSGEPGEMEARIRRHDGVYRWFLIRCSPFRDETGNILRWYGTSTDINDRKVAEEAVKASGRNLSLIINTMPVLAWSALPDGTVDFFNQRWLDYTGLLPEQARGWGWAETVHRDDLSLLTNYWQSMIATAVSGEIEARLRRFDGEYRWFLLRADPMRDEAGAIVKWYGTNTDIDDRKRAEQALRLRELNLLQITETIPEMLWSATPDGAIDYCNGRLLHYTGFQADEIMSDGWTKLLHPDDVGPTFKVWKSCVETGAPYRVEVRTIHAADHTYRWCVTSALPLLDQEGNIVKWHGTVVDMHDWKQAQEELRSTQAELARMMRAMTVGQLTASIAHEVSQPLSGIITNASTCLRMLNSDPPNIDGARETVQRTIRDGNRATDVIARLRTLFSNNEINIESVDLNEAAREVVALLAGELQKDGVVLQDQFSDDLPCVMADRVQLQQVILNLLRNASEAMIAVGDRPRRLLIRTQADGDLVRVSVQDSGIGFDPAIAQRLFESFFTTKQEGMGIGLSVSRSIIEAHHGHLWATRNEGQDPRLHSQFLAITLIWNHESGFTRSSEPIDFATPAPGRDLRNIGSRARPYRCGTP